MTLPWMRYVYIFGRENDCCVMKAKLGTYCIWTTINKRGDAAENFIEFKIIIIINK